MSFLTTIISLFALIGTVASGRWIFRQSWGMLWKFAGCMVLLSLLSAIFSGRAPMVGLYNPLAGILATWGIMLSAIWGFRRAGNDWRWQSAVVIPAVILLGVIWIPVILNPIGALPHVPMGGFTSPMAHASPPPAPHAPATLVPCSAMDPSLRVYVARCNP